MLISVVLTLTPAESLLLPVNLGVEMQAWFLRELRRRDPAVSAWLHETNQRHPYTVSSLRGAQGAYDGKARYGAGSEYRLRITSADPWLSEFLALRWLPELGERIDLDSGARFHILRCATRAQSDPWAGMETPLEIVERADAAPEPAALALEFASPTCFRSQGATIPLPLPRLIVQSLAAGWRALPDAPLALPEGFVEAIDQGMLVSRYTLHTERVVIRHGEARHDFGGFVGSCRFSLRRLEGDAQRMVQVLARFALYAGVGSHTALGLGQVRAG